MITEKHLNYILKEMDYNLDVLALKITSDIFPSLETSSNSNKEMEKFLKEKIAVQKFYVEWIHAHMEEDGA